MGRLPAIPACLLGLMLAACAAGPQFDTADVALSVTPQQAASDFERIKGAGVLWGGVIVNAVNEETLTRLEILAYPLDSRHRPDTDAKAGIRFLAEKAGYLETADYAQGRQVTVKGTAADLRKGRIGDAPHTYPVVRVARIHLWPRAEPRTEPRFHFGIGVIFGN